MLENLTISEGQSYPFGVSWTGPEKSLLNIAVFSFHAASVDFCLFAEDDPKTEIARIRLPGRSADVFHGQIEGLQPGMRYGFRVHGPWDPENGHVFNPAKLLADPYARLFDGRSLHHDSMVAIKPDLTPDETDSGEFAPKSVIPAREDFPWDGDELVRRPMSETVVYEMHVKGFSKQNPEIPEHLRGTYAGLAHDSSIAYLKNLGVTAVQLLPVHQHLDDGFLLNRGLVNYWGYNTLGFFAPEASYAATEDPISEFRGMVKALHAAGIEVILDVVYNHTCEAGMDGPTMLFRGFDNRSYYRVDEKKPQQYNDVTGCGNSVDLTHPRALQLVTDSLRFWVEEMHVDGFRFDLAVTLGREPTKFKRDAAFFKSVKQDPVLSQVKLIAEPWDLGWGGYQVGNFPNHWNELNGKFRDSMRRFWRGDKRVMGEAARRLTGSDDLFYHNLRTPLHSVNFLTSHDGFTLRDLVSYNEKHNLANGEENRDGDSHNTSYNFGVEGETDDLKIVGMRTREVRNFLATMIFAQGVPFITMGDEAFRTQGGNNNAYCQDNEISWMNWDFGETESEMRDFTARLLDFRKRHPAFRKSGFLTGRSVNGGEPDVSWRRRDGKVMVDADWHAPEFPAFAFLLNAQEIEGEANWIFVCLNASAQTLEFTFPRPGCEDVLWTCSVDTNDPNRHGAPGERVETTEVFDHSMQVWIG